MAINIRVTFTGKPIQLARAQHNTFLREAADAMLKEHKATNIPRKFRPGNRERYNFTPRGEGYQKWKLRVRGKNIDLVNSGKSQAQIEGAMVKPEVRKNNQGLLTGEFGLRFNWKYGAYQTTYGPRKTPPKKRFGLRNRMGQRVRPRITPQMMISELRRWHDDEVEFAARKTFEQYWQRIVKMPAAAGSLTATIG